MTDLIHILRKKTVSSSFFSMIVDRKIRLMILILYQNKTKKSIVEMDSLLTTKRKIYSVLLVSTLSLAPSMLLAVSFDQLEDKEGMQVKGYVHDGAAGLCGVLVTNGYSMALTDEKGAYYLPKDSAAEFVYVITPSGYAAEHADGITHFFYSYNSAVEGVQRFDFSLTATEDDIHHKFLVLGDPQCKGAAEFALFGNTPLKNIKTDLKQIHEQGLPTHTLVLGDICFNTWNMYPTYANYLKGINEQMFHIPGNHDKQLVKNKANTCKKYKAMFGPLYYSFNKGHVHYLMLDNIRVSEEYDNTCYSQLYEEAMAWVKKDLSYVPDNRIIVVCAHQPITWNSESLNSYSNLLLELKRYSKVIILTSHKHYAKNIGSPYADNIEERIQTALCGAYWYGNCAKDGTPLGYYVYDVNGDSISWKFRAVDFDSKFYDDISKYNSDFQFKVYGPTDSANDTQKFDLNVFDYDKYWKGVWKLDGVEQGPLSSYEAYDPLAYSLYINHEKSWVRPTITSHMLFALLPNSLFETEVNRQVEFVITDRFGGEHSYSYTINATHIHSIEVAKQSMADSDRVRLFTLNGALCYDGEGCNLDFNQLSQGNYIVSYLSSNKIINKIISIY